MIETYRCIERPISALVGNNLVELRMNAISELT